MQQLAPRVAYLAQIVQDVIQSFGVQKRSRNILDFSDYEHFALRILTNEDGSPSRIAETYREHFKEILVDEYQDTNRVQEKILSCIKTGEEHDGNLFMVGDVKQSIYKFRQADPSLFIEKYNRFLVVEMKVACALTYRKTFVRDRKCYLQPILVQTYDG